MRRDPDTSDIYSVKRALVKQTINDKQRFSEDIKRRSQFDRRGPITRKLTKGDQGGIRDKVTTVGKEEEWVVSWQGWRRRKGMWDRQGIAKQDSQNRKL
jgi:hypothetical protein